MTATLPSVTCSSCPVSGIPAGWKHMTRIDPVTGERTIEWRCPRCDSRARIGLGIGARSEALARARKRGARNQRGKAKEGR